MQSVPARALAIGAFPDAGEGIGEGYRCPRLAAQAAIGLRCSL